MSQPLSQALLKIHGHVQGVFFRASAQQQARALNLTGYAKNLSDGTVEALLQGEKAQIQKFLKWARTGPDSATVNKVEVKWQEQTQTLSEFSVL